MAPIATKTKFSSIEKNTFRFDLVKYILSS